MKSLPQSWTAVVEATVFTGWIYDHLKPHAAALKIAHPLMLRAIAAAKKKNDRIDASKICDWLQVFARVLSRLDDRQRKLLLAMASRMARRERIT
jgi:transposase